MSVETTSAQADHLARAQRTLVVWCPDWPTVAMGVDDTESAAVFSSDRVVACTEAARSHGVHRSQRRRAAQGCCPDLLVIERDLTREFRAFEAVIAVMTRFVPRIEIVRPGVCAVATRGPSRYFGGDEELISRVHEAIEAETRCRVGIADGIFAATLCAKMAHDVRVVPAGHAAEFLAPHTIESLELPELTDVLTRLGLSTLGSFAQLNISDVIGRFGTVGVAAHRLCSGLTEHPLDTAAPDPNLAVSTEMEPPIERVDQAAFLARSLADELCGSLEAGGTTCTALAVDVETEHGEQISRLWRNEAGLGVSAIVDRVRWQLDGWMNGPVRTRPTGGLVKLVLVPEERVAAAGRQLGFWGGESEADTRARRGIARIEGLLSPEAVTVAVFCGGRHGDGFRLVPANSVDFDDRTVTREEHTPWPGGLPTPMPSRVYLTDAESTRRRSGRFEVTLLDGHDNEVTVTGRGLLSAAPASLSIENRSQRSVQCWAGPWLVEERWWDSEEHQRLARVQLVDERNDAYVVRRQDGRWLLEADYR
jgi:protein ImuB